MEALVNQTTFNNILRTEVPSKLFYSLTIIHKFPRQNLKAAFHFCSGTL